MAVSSTLLLVAVACSFFVITLADFSYEGACDGRDHYLFGNNGHIQCGGSINYRDATDFYFNTTKPTILTFRNCTSLNDINLWVNTGASSIQVTNCQQVFHLQPGKPYVRIDTKRSSETSGYFYAIITDAYYDLPNGLATTVNAVQHGGFVYMMPNIAWTYGTSLRVKLVASSYDGLQPPSVFVGVNYLPGLSFYNYYNGTSTEEGYDSVVTLNVTSPPSGRYFFGVFQFGSSTSTTLFALWNYSFPYLGNGEKVASTTAEKQYLQIAFPKKTAQLVLKLSRNVPGGYVVVYVGAGFLANNSTYTYKMDTNQESYIEIKIPKPFNVTGQNPGSYVFNFVSTYNTPAGYLFQASWGNSDDDLGEALIADKMQATIN